MKQLANVLATFALICGLVGISELLHTPTIQAQTLPERPTITPVPQPQENKDRNTAAPGNTGRITGTVIDTTSGAPVPGVTVRVGDVEVVSDANGNYDRSGLGPGSYAVTLVIAPERGTSEQGTIEISLAEGATVVQHLRFHSTPAPTLQPEPSPTTLPNTGGEQSAGGLLLALGLVLLLASGVVRFVARRA